MGKLSRDKGARFERYIARRLNQQEFVSGDFRRELRETQQGNIGDVKDQHGTWPLVIQAKHKKVVDVKGAVREAELAAKTKASGGKHKIPVAWVRWHGGEEVVAMRPEIFLLLLQVLDDKLGGTYRSYQGETDGQIMQRILDDQLFYVDCGKKG